MPRTARNKTAKDAWKERYYRDNHMSEVHDSHLYALERSVCTELRLCAERLQDASLTRIYHDLNLCVTRLLGKVAEIRLAEHCVPVAPEVRREGEG